MITLETYTVWVGGIEVNDYYTDYEVAKLIANSYMKQGYDDTVIERIGQ
jgi:hypothetical protein